MMRLTPRIEYVGDKKPQPIVHSPEQKILQYPNTLSPKERAFLAEFESEKTPDEVEVLGHIDDVTNEITRRFGGTAYHLAKERIHLIRKAGYWKKHREEDEPVSCNRYLGTIDVLEATRADPAIFLFFLLKGSVKQKGAFSIRRDEQKLYLQRNGMATYPAVEREVASSLSWVYFKGVQ